MNNVQFVLVGLITLGSLAIGVAFANPITDLIVNGSFEVNGPSDLNGKLTVNDNTRLNGNLDVVNGNIVTTRNSGGDIGNSLNVAGGKAIFQFRDLDNPQVYRIQLSSLGDEFAFVDFTHSNRNDITIQTSTGNIGIGKNNPLEQLDVEGNIRTTGDVIGVGGMNVNPNGDLCLGSGCQ